MWSKIFILLVQNYLVFISLLPPQLPVKKYSRIFHHEGENLIYLFYIKLLNISFLIILSYYLLVMWYEYYFINDISSSLSYWSCLDMIFIPLTILGALIRLLCLRPHDKVFSLPFEIPLPFIRTKTIYQNAIERIRVYLQIGTLLQLPIIMTMTTFHTTKVDESHTTIVKQSHTTKLEESHTTKVKQSNTTKVKESHTTKVKQSHTTKVKKSMIISIPTLSLPPTPPSSFIIETPTSNNPNKLIKELILKDDYLLYDCVQFPKYTGLIMIWLGKIYFGWRLNDHVFLIIKKFYWYFVIIDLFISIIGLFKYINIEEKIMKDEFGKKKWREFTNNKIIF